MGTTHFWRWSYGDLTWWNLKLKTLKMMGIPRKINAILSNIKINRPKLIPTCTYKLATYTQNFTETYLIWVKILQKVWGGYFFDSHCRSTSLLEMHILRHFSTKISGKISGKISWNFYMSGCFSMHLVCEYAQTYLCGFIVVSLTCCICTWLKFILS